MKIWSLYLKEKMVQFLQKVLKIFYHMLLTVNGETYDI